VNPFFRQNEQNGEEWTEWINDFACLSFILSIFSILFILSKTNFAKSFGSGFAELADVFMDLIPLIKKCQSCWQKM